MHESVCKKTLCMQEDLLKFDAKSNVISPEYLLWFKLTQTAKVTTSLTTAHKRAI